MMERGKMDEQGLTLVRKDRTVKLPVESWVTPGRDFLPRKDGIAERPGVGKLLEILGSFNGSGGEMLGGPTVEGT